MMIRFLACVLTCIVIMTSPVLAGGASSDGFTMTYSMDATDITFNISCTGGTYICMTWNASGSHSASDGITCDATGCNDISLSGQNGGTKDPQQDITVISAAATGGGVSVTFKRALTSTGT